MKAKHILTTDPEYNIIDHLDIVVEGVRQDSLNDQLKDVIQIANEIGCYDAADCIANLFLNKTTTKTPFDCETCDNKMIQPDMLDPKKSFISGCKLLGKKEWTKNLKNGIQTHCPKPSA